jgi:hypothetical protein
MELIIPYLFTTEILIHLCHSEISECFVSRLHKMSFFTVLGVLTATRQLGLVQCMITLRSHKGSSSTGFSIWQSKWYSQAKVLVICGSGGWNMVFEKVWSYFFNCKNLKAFSENLKKLMSKHIFNVALAQFLVHVKNSAMLALMIGRCQTLANL